jgi:hypothetical protein
MYSRTYSECLWTLDSHGNWVWSVTFSLNRRQFQDWNMPTIRNLAYCKQGQAETEDDRSMLEVAIFAHVNHVELRPRQPVGWGFNPDMWLTATICK